MLRRQGCEGNKFKFGITVTPRVNNPGNIESDPNTDKSRIPRGAGAGLRRTQPTDSHKIYKFQLEHESIVQSTAVEP